MANHGNMLLDLPKPFMTRIWGTLRELVTTGDSNIIHRYSFETLQQAHHSSIPSTQWQGVDANLESLCSQWEHQRVGQVVHKASELDRDILGQYGCYHLKL